VSRVGLSDVPRSLAAHRSSSSNLLEFVESLSQHTAGECESPRRLSHVIFELNSPLTLSSTTTPADVLPCNLSDVILCSVTGWKIQVYLYTDYSLVLHTCYEGNNADRPDAFIIVPLCEQGRKLPWGGGWRARSWVCGCACVFRVRGCVLLACV
jgi:hypothetical protein